ncbi:hypothetical protein Tco_0767026 [Tanacetum coccineum]
MTRLRWGDDVVKVAYCGDGSGGVGWSWRPTAVVAGNPPERRRKTREEEGGGEVRLGCYIFAELQRILRESIENYSLMLLSSRQHYIADLDVAPSMGLLKSIVFFFNFDRMAAIRECLVVVRGCLDGCCKGVFDCGEGAFGCGEEVFGWLLYESGWLLL